ncbi:MAG TPA: HAD family hydrolase [Limnochordales bacterium]
MVKALLCDLDGTLLDIDFHGFMRDYVVGVSRYFADCIPPERFQRELVASIEAMILNDVPNRTILQAFMDTFSQRVPLPPDAIDRFYAYYETDFPRLAGYGRPAPGARELLEAALDRGLDLVIATAPFYPERPIRERLRWAGLDDLPFRLITSSEVMHRSKPFREYFLEIAERIGVAPEECLMVGDETVMDGSAAQAGMQVALVGPDRESHTARYLQDPAVRRLLEPGDVQLPRHADLGALLTHLRSTGIL